MIKLCNSNLLFLSSPKYFIEKLIFSLIGYYPLTLSGIKFKCDHEHIIFWKDASRGNFEPYTYNILSKFLNHSSIYCDIGAWIGPTVIYAAMKCKKVYCFEPDIFAYEQLLHNIRLNKLKNVLPFNIALTNTNDIKEMSSFGSYPGDAASSLLNPNKGNTVHALCMSWQNWINISKMEKLDFVKIDIEGAEFDLLPTMFEYFEQVKPIVYLSTHVPFLEQTKRKDAIQQSIMPLIRIYKKCFNEKLELVKINDCFNHNVLNNFKSYLLMN